MSSESRQLGKVGILIIHTNAGIRYVEGNKKCKCAQCGKPFVKNENPWSKTPIIVTEEQVSCMRGDDIVKFYHPSCFDEFNKTERII